MKYVLRLKKTILSTTALIVPDFGSVKFILNTTSMIQLNSAIDLPSQRLNIRKNSFVFKTYQHCKIKANDSAIIGIRCAFPKFLRSGDFLGKSFRPFSKYLPNNFLLKFKRGQSYIKITNHTSRALNIKGNTALGGVSFDLVSDISKGRNTITHYYTDLDGSIYFCSQEPEYCPIYKHTEVSMKEVKQHCLYNNCNCENVSMQNSRANYSKEHVNVTHTNNNKRYNIITTKTTSTITTTMVI